MEPVRLTIGEATALAKERAKVTQSLVVLTPATGAVVVGMTAVAVLETVVTVGVTVGVTVVALAVGIARIHRPERMMIGEVVQVATEMTTAAALVTGGTSMAGAIEVAIEVEATAVLMTATGVQAVAVAVTVAVVNRSGHD